MKKYIVLIAAFVLSIQLFYSQEYKYDYESVEGDPTNTLIYTLENGLNVYMSVYEKEPRIQTYIAVRAGSKDDPEETTGLAHYLEHMLFKGTDEIGTKDWEKEEILLQQISDLYEKHRHTKDDDHKKKIYQRIDSLSFLASEYAIPSEYDKMVSSLGAKGTNAYTYSDGTVYVNDIPSNELEKWIMVESERFQTLVLRLFHTELETVYEEFNRTQDSDQRQVYQTLLKGLFPDHPYGTQTTIGNGAHLKNPSMVNIHNYFDRFYVPNNIAICLSGDIDPDQTVDLIRKYFGEWTYSPIVDRKDLKSEPLKEPVVQEVLGPQKESLYIGFKFDGASSEQTLYVHLIDALLSNGHAGLIDLNINQKQRLLNGASYYWKMQDHSIHILYGVPKDGQTLEEARDILFEELDKIKNGAFEEWLLDAVIQDFILQQKLSHETNRGRANEMVSAFLDEISWEEHVRQAEKLSDITKDDIVQFARANYSDNYALAYKRKGEANRNKVSKPSITPIQIDREATSAFYDQFATIPPVSTKPVFVDFQEAIAVDTVHTSQLSYIYNEDNSIFRLYYVFDIGEDHGKEFALALSYLPYLGTSIYTAEELKKEMFKLSVSMNTKVERDRLYVSLSGLEKNANRGIQLLEHILAEVQSDTTVYNELVKDILKRRSDEQLNKNLILRQGLVSYAKYGDHNPFTNRYSEQELLNISPDFLTSVIHQIREYPHRIFYYGQHPIDTVMDYLHSNHSAPISRSLPAPVEYHENAIDQNAVYFIPYDMKQAEILLLSRGEPFSVDLLARASIFNEYFGAGLSSIVFQEIREKKALAYSAYSWYSNPNKKGEHHYLYSYIGTQADKMEEAILAMQVLLENMPLAQEQFDIAKQAALKKMQTDWITGAEVYWAYEKAMQQGVNEDIRKQVYEEIQAMTLDDLSLFFDEYIKAKKYALCVIGKEGEIDISYLQTLGDFQQLTVEDVFPF